MITFTPFHYFITYIILFIFAVFSRASDLPGTWELLVHDVGIASMHTAVTHFGTVVLLDRTNIGPTKLLLPKHHCRNDSNDAVLKHDCYAHSALFDPTTNHIRPLIIQTDTWCSSGQFLPDGTLLQTGGDMDGWKKIRKFTPCETTEFCDWEELNDVGLSQGRWYSTNQILPNGDVIIVGGRVAFSVEFYPPRENGAVLFPFLADVADRQGDNLYPYVHLLPNGKLFIFANTKSVLYDYDKNLILKKYPSLDGGPRNYPSAGSSVMLALEGDYSTAVIVVCGGAKFGAYITLDDSVPAIGSCGRIVATSDDPVWEMEVMPFARVMGDMVMLPTGEVLIINGAQSGTQGFDLASNPCLNPVLYRPDQPVGLRFMVLNPGTIPRMYHSTANLLPDGRVLLAGSNPHYFYNFKAEFPTELRLEAFSPEYLSPDRANLRPEIKRWPKSLKYGQEFEVEITTTLPLVAPIEINLGNAPFATHSFSQGQRLVKLDVKPATPSNNGCYIVSCVAPPNAMVAPPSYYMMFAFPLKRAPRSPLKRVLIFLSSIEAASENMMKRYVYINDDESVHELYCDNRVSNRKYTLLNFLPKNLLEQFSRFMNQYFLLIACLQLWPLITPVNPASTWGPLIFIFAVSATKEAWDDYNRFLSDKNANEKEVWVVRNGIRKHIQSQDIHVGNLVWLRENDEVPCDLVLLGSSDPQGTCYVETAALDGETDLKRRVIPSACMGIDFELLQKIKGVIECPNPDKDIMRFDANLRLFPPFIDNDLCPLTIDNTILQSCYLRNTEWACGVAVYTGNETKLGMSRGIPEPKLTAVDAMIDKLTGAIFVFQIVVVTVLGVAGNVWKDSEARKQWYVLYPKESPWYELLIIPLRFELLCSIMIPISIKVSLDLVKSLYAKFIDWDLEMFDQETGVPSHAANTAISEDLGQVEYILTDKTGTLTENKMVFKKCCIGGVFYGSENGDALKDAALLDAVSSGSSDIIRSLTVMAICNTVIPTKSKRGDVVYKSQSQDEEALVQAAAQLHMFLINKAANILEINCNGSLIQYELLDVLEFTSDRKRMSVVVRDYQNGKIMLLSKGADEAIFPCAITGQHIRTFTEAVEHYAQLGLRTLCLACRELKEDEYREWSLMFKEASSTLVDREWRIAEVCQLIEHDLEILAVTAIEDRLQNGVPETIDTLRKAGINFWMLTGDKQGTAIQIALSCNFVFPEPKGQLLLIDGKTADEVRRNLERVLCTMRITTAEPKDVAFVIDGWALEIALKHSKKEFSELAILSRTAICCRVTPSQKAQLVQLLKSCDYKTLAIGDGGNDVRMIQQADIGVGISGREGLQAARAADYSIGRFQFLKRLILVHGRYSYNRTAFLSQYSFYKSLIICFIQIFYSFVSGISGTSLFNSVSLMAYNVFYTSVPVLVSVLDKDLNERTVMQHPQILFYCQAGRVLNPSTFAGWFGRSLFHAIVVFIISLNAYAGEKSETEQVAMVALSGCIWLQAFVVALETNSFTILQHLAIWGNLVAFYIINLIVSTIPSSGMHTIMFRLCKQPSYWITMFLIVVAGMGPILALKYFRFTYRPSKINILQQAERLGGPILSLGNIEPQPRLIENEAIPMSVAHPKRTPVFEPLLPGSPNSTRRSFGPGTPFEFFQTQGRLSSNYSRNCKTN